MSVFETIKLYFTLADTSLLNEMFDKAFGRTNDEANEVFVRDSCLEILRSMMSFVDVARVKVNIQLKIMIFLLLNLMKKKFIKEILFKPLKSKFIHIWFLVFSTFYSFFYDHNYNMTSSV